MGFLVQYIWGSTCTIPIRTLYFLVILNGRRIQFSFILIYYVIENHLCCARIEKIMLALTRFHARERAWRRASCAHTLSRAKVLMYEKDMKYE